MIKDRLADLMRSHQSDDEDEQQDAVSINITGAYGGPWIANNEQSWDMQDFLADVDEIRQMIDSIQKNVDEVKIKHSDMLSAPHTDEKLKMKLEDLMSNIKRNANKVRAKLKMMEEIIEHEESAPTSFSSPLDLRIRKTQHSSLLRKFVDTMLEYNGIQADHRDRCKARIQRQLEIAGITTTNQELEDMLEQGSPVVFTQGIIMETQQAKQTCADIVARHADIIKLESSIKQLHDMFIDMVMLVDSQGELVDRIEHHVNQTINFVGDGTRDLGRAKVYRRKSRKKLILIVVCLITVLLIFITILLF